MWHYMDVGKPPEKKRKKQKTEEEKEEGGAKFDPRDTIWAIVVEKQ